ncbi:MAG: alpha-isopropylmalate synthase regulatory domain-containing protein [Cyclobacteriaceae bacterium]
MRTIEIMDTSLRDGEQTSGVAFTSSEKLNIAKFLLEEVKVDRIEVASARISKGEFQGVQNIVNWATQNNHLHKVEILGFVDKGKSLDWINKAGAKVVNLLCKGSKKHLEGQLKKTLEQHVSDIKEAVEQATKLGIEANLYLEDWSNGMRDSEEYVLALLNALKDTKIKRFMLPDTLGTLNPEECFDYYTKMVSHFPDLHFDSHLHNDYDLAIGNTFYALKAGVKGIHTTVNGLGERAGNTPLASAVALIEDQFTDLNCNVTEGKLNQISRLVEAFSGVHIPHNKPVVGDNVFTQACGVHADGDNKGGLYFNKLMPERFGRTREYALGKTSGKASIQKNLEELGIVLSAENMQKVTERVVELGDKKELITKEDLPFIISDVLGSEMTEEKVKLLNYYSTHVHNLRPVTTIKIEIDGQVFEETATGDGQYDAFMRAMKNIYAELGKELPILKNYKISIPPGGRTDALVETVITWELNGKEFKTRGLESDQQAAAITATVKMLNSQQ